MKLGNKTEQVFVEISELLLSAGLVPVGLDSDNLHFFYQQNDCGEIIGVVGVEVYAPNSLLRSLAVREDMRNNGIARSLINEAIEFARSIKSYNLYLLTETIGKTMYRYGFRDIPREQVSDDLLASPFFNGICPCCSQLMHKNIQEG
jgi:amino-acid N-acetyltransferase